MPIYALLCEMRLDQRLDAAVLVIAEPVEGVTETKAQ
jgi:hypothetical protein